MKREYKLFLQDIRDCMVQIEKYMQGISRDSFDKNMLLQDAVIRRLEIIGEATKNIPKSLKDRNNHVPWYDMTLFRDVVIHGYYEVGLNRVWNVVKEDLPKIKEAMKNIVLV